MLYQSGTSAFNLVFEKQGDFKEKVYILGLKSDDRTPVLTRTPKLEDLEEEIKKIKFEKNVNYYIGANTFVEKSPTRKDDNVFGLRNIVLDIDFHGVWDYEEKCVALENILREYWEEKGFPIWNILNMTGRGIQLWWTFEQVSRKLEFLYRKVKNAIIDEVNKAMAEYAITLDNEKVDFVASTRLSGVYRLFDTFNTRANTYAVHKIENEQKYTLNGLRDAFLPEMANQVKNQVKKQTKRKRTKRGKRSKKPFKGFNTNDLNLVRVKMIEALIEYRNLEKGNELRDLHLYIYYNEAVQCFPREVAKDMTIELNNKFKVPLKESQLRAIFCCIDKAKNNKTDNNHYILTNKYIIETLRMSEEDQTMFNFFPAGDDKGKNAARDRRRREKREERNRIIIENYLRGETYAQMARLAGCCAKTAKKVVLEYEESLKDKELYAEPEIIKEIEKESIVEVEETDTLDYFVIPELKAADTDNETLSSDDEFDYFVIPELEFKDEYDDFVVPSDKSTNTPPYPKEEKMEGKIYYGGAARSEANSKPLFRGIRKVCENLFNNIHESTQHLISYRGVGAYGSVVNSLPSGLKLEPT